ncbi:hypothetical protein ACW5QP_14620, partial [Microbacterium arborescens]
MSREQQSWGADPYADLDWNPDEFAPPEDFDAPPPPEFDGYGAAVARATRDRADAAASSDSPLSARGTANPARAVA